MILTGVTMCPIPKGRVSHDRTLKRLPLLWALAGLLSMLTLGALVGTWGTFGERANASHDVLARSAVSASAPVAGSSSARLEPLPKGLAHNAYVRSQSVEAPAPIHSAPVASEHPATLLAVEAPEPGEGGTEAGDDLNDFDEPVDDESVDALRALRVGVQLHWEIEPGVSRVGRAVSRLADNRSDKPPRA